MNEATHPGGLLLDLGTFLQSLVPIWGIILQPPNPRQLDLYFFESFQKTPHQLDTVMEQAGIDSRAGTILFSLPVTDTAGIRFPDEAFDDTPAAVQAAPSSSPEQPAPDEPE